jgi:hypothetical protein
MPGTLVTKSTASSRSSVVISPVWAASTNASRNRWCWAALTCLRRSPARWRRRAGGELPGVCLADREHFGDLPVGVVERFAEHVGGSFDGRQVLEEHEHRTVERFGALRAVRAVGLDVDRLGEPRADMGRASCSGRLGDVDRESSRGGGGGGGGGGGEKRYGVPHLAAIGALSAHPRLLHHVVGVCRASKDAIGDTEEARADGLKRRGVRIGDLGVRRSCGGSL